MAPRQFFFQSFNHRLLGIIRKKKPEWEVVPLVGGGPEDRKHLIAAPIQLKASMVTPHYHNVTPETVSTLRQKGVKVVSWTANSKSEMMALIENGADGLITDRVDLFQELKQELCGP